MKSVAPRYQYAKTVDPNYGPGWIGFSYRDDSLISIGIALFTKEEEDKILTSHCFIVQDEITLIEAGGAGVVTQKLKAYFDDPHTAVFFKKPIHLTRDRAFTIVRRAVGKIGNSYDYSLFFYFLSRFLFLRYVEKKFPYWKKCPSLFASSDEYICSSLVSDCLNQIEEYSNLIPLAEYHISKIDPMDLFRSKELFEPWAYEE